MVLSSTLNMSLWSAVLHEPASRHQLPLSLLMYASALARQPSRVRPDWLLASNPGTRCRLSREHSGDAGCRVCRVARHEEGGDAREWRHERERVVLFIEGFRVARHEAAPPVDRARPQRRASGSLIRIPDAIFT